MSQQRGFTLLELMVAMAIFAMLAVAGWQVFDSVNRARERAQFHADNLAVLQYAYLQLQQDMGQITAYQAPSESSSNPSSASDSTNNSPNNDNANSNANNSNDEAVISPKPFMTMDSEHVSFVRFADPDPRYQTSPSLQHVEYLFADQRLIRRQYMSIQGGRDSASLDSVLLEDVSLGRWQAFLPEISSKFPNEQNNQTTVAANADKAKTKLLPKGIGVSFTYQDMPITWQWSLAPQPTPIKSGNSNNDDNSDGNNANNNSNDNSNNNSNDATGNSNNNSGSSNNNASENTPTVQ